VAGVNQIKVTAFFPTAAGTGVASGSSQVLVVYSSSFQTKTVPSSSPSANASGPADIKQKVAQDVANAMSQPKAYIGTVTDITDSTIQIKTASSDINQISVSPDSTTVVNTTGTISKTVKTTDIAIGDFVVALGYINGNSVLTAQRILITNAITAPNLTVNEAKVSSVTKKILTVNKATDNSQDTVQPDKNTDIETLTGGSQTPVKFSSFTAGNEIIYVETTDAKGLTSVRSIFQLSS